MLQPVILAGGAGTRLWPLSRERHPKQFLRLGGERTLLQETLARLEGLPALPPIVVCNSGHRFLAAEQLRASGTGDAAILLEPEGRGTAAAVAVAAHYAARDGADPTLLVLSADHSIADVPTFRTCVGEAAALAEEGRLVALGVPATRPDTGYGYILPGEPLEGGAAIALFREKPGAEEAGVLIGRGALWNAGIFAFRARRVLEEMRRLRPQLAESCARALRLADADLGFLRLDEAAYRSCEFDSFDAAVMENAEDTAVVRLDAGWADLGSWTAVHEAADKDGAGNAAFGDVLLHEARDSLAYAESRLVALLGVRDLVVVETRDAVLVADPDRLGDVRDIARRLSEDGRTEHLDAQDEYRPWGHFSLLGSGDRDRVKRITVKPGEGLSAQRHRHRAEHWVVVRGTARVRRGDEILILHEDESTYIPVGVVHALENPGPAVLEVIEVQSGSYLGEDDIERLKDRYGRD